MKRFPDIKNDSEHDGLFVSHRGSDKSSEKSFGCGSEDSDHINNSDIKWSNLHSSSLESADALIPSVNIESEINDNVDVGIGSGVNGDSNKWNYQQINRSVHLTQTLDPNPAEDSVPDMALSNRKAAYTMTNSTLNDLTDHSRASSIFSKPLHPKSFAPNCAASLREWVTIINKFASDEVRLFHPSISVYFDLLFLTYRDDNYVDMIYLSFIILSKLLFSKIIIDREM